MRISIECLKLKDIRDLEMDGLEGSIERKGPVCLHF